jgi:soluble lytic murein transglycosylase-like protein
MFTMRARRRRVRKRLVLGIWITCVLGAVAGVPFADAGLNISSELFGRFEPKGGIETSESAAGLMRFRSASFKTRPTPTPTPEVAEPETYVAPAGSVAAIIYAAAEEFGVDGGWLLSIASCESGLNTAAHNPAGYYGLFQFDQGTWASYGYGSIYDATAQARTAARLIAAGQASRWPSCA